MGYYLSVILTNMSIHEFGDITTISPNHIEASYDGNTLHLMRGDMSNMNMIN
jgi:hypothetical protein